ncbi:hypothetical protein COOONC_03158 [Cooperia oncophora]
MIDIRRFDQLAFCSKSDRKFKKGVSHTKLAFRLTCVHIFPAAPNNRMNQTGPHKSMRKGFVTDSDGSVDVEKIDITEDFEKEINSRMALVYTGKTRLAKNLLQEVVRGWYSGGPVREVISSLENNVGQFAAKIRGGLRKISLNRPCAHENKIGFGFTNAVTKVVTGTSISIAGAPSVMS